MTKNGTLTPTSAAMWRTPREEGFLITLPSGNVARLRPVALDVLITTGKLPDILTPIAAKTLWTEEDTDKIANAPELAKGFAELVYFVQPAAFLEPVVIADGEPGDGEIHIEDIDFSDKVAVFNLATAGADALRKFCNKQTAALEPVPNGKSNSVKTKRSSRNKRPVDSAATG